MPRQVLFLDPDNGFEPKNHSEKHVRYDELATLLERMPAESVVTVFQHFRRKPFPLDFADNILALAYVCRPIQIFRSNS